jgi:hypothetical protein
LVGDSEVDVRLLRDKDNNFRWVSSELTKSIQAGRTRGDKCEDGDLLPDIIKNCRSKFLGCPSSVEKRVARNHGEVKEIFQKLKAIDNGDVDVKSIER